MPGFQSTRLVTEGALEPFFFLYTDDSIQGNPETCKQSNVMLNYEVKNRLYYYQLLKSFIFSAFLYFKVFEKGVTSDHYHIIRFLPYFTSQSDQHKKEIASTSADAIVLSSLTN